MGWGAVRGDITHSDLQPLAGSADEPLLLPLRGRRIQFLRETVLKARRHGPVSSGKEGDGCQLSAVGGVAQQSSELLSLEVFKPSMIAILVFKALSDANFATSAREAAGEIPAPKRKSRHNVPGLV